jgi:protein involved in polysaccharide export with SLBB domain
MMTLALGALQMIGSLRKLVMAAAAVFCMAAGVAAAQPVASLAAAPGTAVSGEYRLGPGDKIRVITFGEASLTGEFLVSGAGRVSFPLIGDVDATGKSAGEFQAAVENALKDGYIKEPKVSVEVLTYRPFYILGEVMKPGEYPYTNALNVNNAVATAGGFTYRADTKRVFIKRANEQTEESYPLTASILVAPGDTIRIKERFF